MEGETLMDTQVSLSVVLVLGLLVKLLFQNRYFFVTFI